MEISGTESVTVSFTQCDSAWRLDIHVRWDFLLYIKGGRQEGFSISQKTRMHFINDALTYELMNVKAWILHNGILFLVIKGPYQSFYMLPTFKHDLIEWHMNNSVISHILIFFK